MPKRVVSVARKFLASFIPACLTDRDVYIQSLYT